MVRVLVGDLLPCMVIVSGGHRVLCAAAAHWPVVTVASETEVLYAPFVSGTRVLSPALLSIATATIVLTPDDINL